MIPWSDLPKELVEHVGRCLHTYIDVLRFRSVCTTWRSSLSPFKTVPPLPFQLPLTYQQSSHRHYRRANAADFYLIQSTVYLFQPPDDVGAGGWLVKVAQTLDRILRVMNPVTDGLINVFPDSMPRVLNLLDFRVSQVCKSYHVQYFNPSRPSLDVGHLYSKILLSANQADCFSLLGIDHTGLLLYLNSGDENWTELKDVSCNIADIILYKGNFCAVDRYGKTVKFDSSFNETTIVSSILYDIRGTGSPKMHLVESLGQLLLVDVVLVNVSCPHPLLIKATDIKIYRLDEEKHEWVAVTSLGDRIFFAGDDCCFSVSSQVFGESCRGNCIYFANRGTTVGKNWDFSYGGRFGYNPIRGRGGSLQPDYLVPSNRHAINFFGPIVFEDEIRSNYMDKGGSGTGGLSMELVHRYEGLHNNTGVFTIEDGKIIQSLSSCLEYADIFWPPPSWLNQARSDTLGALNFASSMTQTLSKELADVKKKLLDLAFSTSNFNSPNPVLLEAPLDPTKELSRLLVEHKYEEAFSAALQRSDVSNIVPWLCSQVDLAGILSMNPLPLSEGVLVSLLQQLALDVIKETSPKLSWMRDVLSAINSSSCFLTRN